MSDVSVDFLSAVESRDLFNSLCLQKLGIPAHEFVQQMNAGEYKHDDSREIDELMILLPFWNNTRGTQ